MKCSAADKPDIIFIVLDTHRADRLSCYGYSRLTSPHIDSFAAGATLFERAISPAQWTIPSHASMFTGEYPTAHGVLQACDVLDDARPTLAELLQANGYHTIGFSNNALVGSLDNKFTRGFDNFYNYGGMFTSEPEPSLRPKSLRGLRRTYQRLISRIGHFLQNRVASSDLVYRLAMNPVIASTWPLFVQAKGNTVRSLRDSSWYFRRHRNSGRNRRPIFLFINLMETHPSWWPPRRFIDRFAPYLWHERAARDFARSWNSQLYRWSIPTIEPFSELEGRVLNDLYDASVAYQDRLLGRFFRRLQALDDTMVIITSDHGEGLGEHDFVGHSFVVYEEVVHVPLIVRYPLLYPSGRRLSAVVSSRRIFHTILQAAGVSQGTVEHALPGGVQDLSLVHTVRGADPERELVFSEAYPPMPLLRAMERRHPDAIDRFRCRLMRRAVYSRWSKLIKVDGAADEMFDVLADPSETSSLLEQRRDQARLLDDLQCSFFRPVEGRVEERERTRIDLSEDELVEQRLRDLGYIE
jgi:arylsulfatase A-like enzyme